MRVRRPRGPVTVALLVAGALTIVACAPDGDADDRGSAVIVTTTGTPGTSSADAADATTVPPTAVPPTSGTPATGDAPAATAPSTPASTEPPATSPSTDAPEPTVGDPVVRAELVAELDSPVGLAARPDDPALYVLEQPGRVVRVDGGASTVVADLTDRISSGGERGLLGLAFSPDGSRAYVDYTDLGGDTVVSELPVAADGRLDADAERVLLTVDQPYGNHNGGDVVIGPDGMLYVSLGDGGSGGDPERRASDPTSLLGSLVRIDPAPSEDRAYTIPPDNPFADGEHGGVAGAPEVWAYGLRNPWRIAFDPVTGDLWIADVGQNAIEEIDHVPADPAGTAGRGANFGWSAFEGTARFNDDVPDPGDLVFPVLTYEHGPDGCSISGGAPYRGSAIAGLAPAYVYSDYCSGVVWALDLAGGRNLTLLTGFQAVTAVRAGPDGELYVLEQSGALHRLVPA